MFEAILLGVIQGLTEFLPISSSAHLTIVQHMLGIKEGFLIFDVWLHMGTLLAVILFFYRDIIAILKDRQYVMYILTATLVTGVIGIAFEDFFSSTFHNPIIILTTLIINGLLLLTTKNKDTQNAAISLRKAVTIGLAQSISILPGISRSGITIATMLHLGMDRKEAFKFSFILSIPVIAGVFLLKIKDVYMYSAQNIWEVTVGTLFAFVSGLFALKLLKFMMNKAKMYLFGYYCIVIGVGLLWFL